jgi:hypothetical protein
MSRTTPASGSAEKWGPLWGARPRAWGVNEEMQVPTYMFVGIWSIDAIVSRPEGLARRRKRG